MLTLTAHLDKQRYTPRCYVVAASDRMGEAKANAVEACGREVLVMPGCCCCANTETSARAFELAMQAPAVQATVCKIPRSREVGQSYLTSVWTTLVALCAAFSIVFSQQPELVGVNLLQPACCRRVYKQWCDGVHA